MSNVFSPINAALYAAVRDAKACAVQEFEAEGVDLNSDTFLARFPFIFVKEFNNNDRRFIKYLLESIDLKSLGENVAAVPSLDRKNAHRIPVPLPPPPTQRENTAPLLSVHYPF